MGYRSDVKIVLARNDELAKRTEHYELWVSGEGAGSILKTLEEYFNVEEKDQEVDCSAKARLKWNLEYPEVASIVTYLDWLDSEDLGQHYQFIRIGESFEDEEYRGGLGTYWVDRVFAKAWSM